MLTPFEILELSETANDEAIKKAYLKKVRQYPPEQAPDKFQQIRDAYELIKTERLRISYQLFNHEKPDFLQLLAQTLKSNGAIKRVDETLFTKTLAESLKPHS
ncbi:MAG: DnaJ domain-containing protein [Methylococcaceae bacterium]|nr:DnaJ domain-containing protein [Methylococcaceae bacterium]